MKNKKASGNDIIPANFHAREKVIHVMSPYSLLEIQEWKRKCYMALGICRSWVLHDDIHPMAGETPVPEPDAKHMF